MADIHALCISLVSVNWLYLNWSLCEFRKHRVMYQIFRSIIAVVKKKKKFTFSS